jgi:hypothetical protein
MPVVDTYLHRSSVVKSKSLFLFVVVINFTRPSPTASKEWEAPWKLVKQDFCHTTAISAGAVCHILGYGIKMAVDEASSNGVGAFCHEGHGPWVGAWRGRPCGSASCPQRWFVFAYETDKVVCVCIRNEQELSLCSHRVNRTNWFVKPDGPISSVSVAVKGTVSFSEGILLPTKWCMTRGRDKIHDNSRRCGGG